MVLNKVWFLEVSIGLVDQVFLESETYSSVPEESSTGDVAL